MKKRPLDERVLSFLGWNKNFTIPGLAVKLKEPVENVAASVKRLVDEGLAHRVQGTKYESYHATTEAKDDPAGHRYVPPFRELKGYDMGRLQRSCEGARKAETGMA